MTATTIIRPDDKEKGIESIVRFLQAFMPGKPIKVTVDEYKPPRSEPQNNALFGV